MPNLLQIALSYYGLFEWKDGTNPKLKEIFGRVGRILGYNFEQYDDSILSWCGVFMAEIFWEAGLGDYIPRDAQGARKWLSLGDSTDWQEVSVGEAVAGDVVVFWRNSPSSWQGHVALFVNDRKNGRIRTLGGNQSNGVVIRSYQKSKILKIYRYAGK